MKFIVPILATVALATAVPAHGKIERDVKKSFTVAGPGTLHLETRGGSISVAAGPVGAVTITAHERIRASSEAEADEVLKDLDLRFEQNGNDIRATAKYPNSGGGWSFLGLSFGPPSLEVDFTAVVPAAYATELHTSGGSITVGDLDGKVFARTSGGSIKLGRLGGSADAHTSGGSIRCEEARGAVELNTSGGSISVGRVAGPAALSTSGGGIHIESVEQAVRAHTSGGSISARIAGPLKGDCSLSTSGGGVHVVVSRSAAYHLDASTSGGGVHAEGLTITLGGRAQRNNLNGDVNGGGPLLKLRTSGGSIDIQAD